MDYPEGIVAIRIDICPPAFDQLEGFSQGTYFLIYGQRLVCTSIRVPSPKDALRESVIKLNEITETTNLCGITRRRVKDIYRTGKLLYNVDLTFSVKETVCSKNSGLEFDEPSCHFCPRKTAEKGFYQSRVEYFAGEVIDIDVECRGLKTVDSSSESSESSEDSIELKIKSKETSLEKSSNMKSKSTESSNEESSNADVKSSLVKDFPPANIANKSSAFDNSY
uniref:secreted phosphoprotein 24-like n=1 Tax=Pristiophorus japonicus TaxID=55135 RepID=UPI00398E38F5